MRSVIFSLIFLFSTVYAHDGGHGGDEPTPSQIEKGKLKGKDDIVYLDAGSEIEWARQKLKRKITNNQLIYQYTAEDNEALKTSTNDDKYYEVKISGGEVLKTFAFSHAGESHDFVKITSPDFTEIVQISKEHDLAIRWVADESASMIKIIIEVFSNSGSLTGHLTVSTNDDGTFDIPIKLLSQLPEGSAKIALRRIWLGEFSSPLDSKQMLGVRTSVSSVANAKVVAD